MSKGIVLGVAAGFAAGAAAAVAGKILVDKIVCEIKGDLEEQTFTSPNGENTVTMSFGSSQTARGLTYIRVKAFSQAVKDECKLVLLARGNEGLFVAEWIGDDTFKLLIGKGKRRQCCEVTFAEDKITAQYYLQKMPVAE